MSDFPDWTDGITLLSAPVVTEDFPDWTKATSVPSGLPGSGGAYPGPALITGNWYTNLTMAEFTGALSLVANCLTAHPIWLPVGHTFTGIGVGVVSSVAAPAVVRLGIYTDSGMTPNSLVLDAGTVATQTSSAAATITISQTLQAGYYWLAASNQGVGTNSAQFAEATIPPAELGWGTPSWGGSVNPRLGYTNVGGVSGALPGTFPASVNNAGVVAVWLQA